MELQYVRYLRKWKNDTEPSTVQLTNATEDNFPVLPVAEGDHSFGVVHVGFFRVECYCYFTVGLFGEQAQGRLDREWGFSVPLEIRLNTLVDLQNTDDH